MTSIEFFAAGRPAPQGSKRALGPGRMIEMSQYVKPWRAAVNLAARNAAALDGWAILDEPCALEVVFYLARPVNPKFPSPGVAPDLSKLVRSTEDALNRVIWWDDARVVSTTSAKTFVGVSDLQGAWIKVSTLAKDAA